MAELDRKVYTITVTGRKRGTARAECPICGVERRHADLDKVAGMVQAHMIGQHAVAATTRHKVNDRRIG